MVTKDFPLTEQSSVLMHLFLLVATKYIMRNAQCTSLFLQQQSANVQYASARRICFNQQYRMHRHGASVSCIGTAHLFHLFHLFHLGRFVAEGPLLRFANSGVPFRHVVRYNCLQQPTRPITDSQSRSIQLISRGHTGPSSNSTLAP